MSSLVEESIVGKYDIFWNDALPLFIKCHYISESEADLSADHGEEMEVLEGYEVPDEDDQRAHDESQSSQLSALSPEPTPSSSGSGTPGAGRRGKKTNFQNEILKRWDLLDDDMKQQEERIRQTDEKMLELEQRRTELLEQFVTDTGELKNAFVSFLNSKTD